MLQSKNIPLALFALFCIKALITGWTWETSLCLGVAGIVAFLYEAFIQNKAINDFKAAVAEIKASDEHAKKELEAIKAYVSSLKLNNIRTPQNGFNRTQP